MAIYNFFCDQCKKNFEEIVSIGTQSFKCKDCDSFAKKVFSKPNAVTIFKGKGWTHPCPNSIK